MFVTVGAQLLMLFLLFFQYILKKEFFKLFAAKSLCVDCDVIDFTCE